MALLLSLVPVVAVGACGLSLLFAMHDAPGMAVAASSFTVAMAGSGARRLVTDPGTLRRTPFGAWVLASVVEVVGLAVAGWFAGGAAGEPDLRIGAGCVIVAVASLAADAWQASFVDLDPRASLARRTLHRDLLDRAGIVADPPYRAKVLLAYLYAAVIVVASVTAGWGLATLVRHG